MSSTLLQSKTLLLTLPLFEIIFLWTIFCSCLRFRRSPPSTTPRFWRVYLCAKLLYGKKKRNKSEKMIPFSRNTIHSNIFRIFSAFFARNGFVRGVVTFTWLLIFSIDPTNAGKMRKRRRRSKRKKRRRKKLYFICLASVTAKKAKKFTSNFTSTKHTMVMLRSSINQISKLKKSTTLYTFFGRIKKKLCVFSGRIIWRNSP